MRKTANMDGAEALPWTGRRSSDPPCDPSRTFGESSRLAGDRDAFAQQQVALHREPVAQVAPAVAAPAAERAVGRDDPVARDQERDRVAAERAADGPRRAAARRSAGRSRRSSPSGPTGSRRRRPGRAGPRPAGRRGRAVTSGLARRPARNASIALTPPARWRSRRSKARPAERTPGGRRRRPGRRAVGTAVSSKAASVISHSTATTPRSVAATWTGPHGPASVVLIATGSSIARV